MLLLQVAWFCMLKCYKYSEQCLVGNTVLVPSTLHKCSTPGGWGDASIFFRHIAGLSRKSCGLNHNNIASISKLMQVLQIWRQQMS